MEEEEIVCTVPLPEIKIDTSKRSRNNKKALITSGKDLNKEIQRIQNDTKKLDLFRKVKLEAAEIRIIKKLPVILDMIIEQAEKGNLQAAKLLLDRVLPVQKPAEGISQPKLTDKGFSINITVNGASNNGKTLEGVFETLSSSQEEVD